MAAYVIVDIEVHDPVVYEEYRTKAAPTVIAKGGKYLVRGGAVATLEGEWPTHRFVVLEFPTAERAREWWACPEYAPVMTLRHRSATTKMILVEGV
jgi:uncharacterized protein (DUF1330 family)